MYDRRGNKAFFFSPISPGDVYGSENLHLAEDKIKVARLIPNWAVNIPKRG